MKSTDITKIYLGSTQGEKLYLGDELVWPVSGPTPTPTGQTVAVTYNVTSTTVPTNILQSNGLSQFSQAQLADSTIIPVAATYTFSQTGLQTVYYTPTGTTIAGIVFNSTSPALPIVSIVFPEGITELGGYFLCAYNTQLTGVTFPNSLQTIGGSAFIGCTALQSVTIPSGVTDMEGHVFAGCTGLTEVIIEANAPQYTITTPPFDTGSTSTFPIYVPDNQVNAWKGAFEMFQYIVNRIYPISERIPANTYLRLPYFQSTGAEYIVADYATPGFNETMWAEYEFRLTEMPTSTNKHVLSGNNYRFAQIDSAGNWKVYRGGNTITITSSPFTTGVTRKYTFFKSNDEILVDGVAVGTLTDPAIMGSADNIHPRFFSVNGSTDSATYGAKGYLYRAKIGTINNIDDEEFLEAYYVPAQRKSDGVNGLYDLITPTFIPCNTEV